MADSRGGLGSIARNGNAAARTYGAGLRPRSRDDGPLRVAGGGGARPRAGSKSTAAASGKTLAGTTAHVARPAGGGGAEPSDPDPDPDPDAAGPVFRRILEAGGRPGYHEPPRSGGARAVCAVRRAVLLGGVAGGAALLAGCGGDDGGDGGGGASGGGDPSAAAQVESASPNASPTVEPSLEPFPGADDGGGAAAGSGLIKTSEVPVGGAVLVDSYLIAQPRAGVFKAFDATCPHQGIMVDAPIGSNDYFICPGHNSKFRLADGGRISGPAPRGLKQVPVKVRNGFVVEA